MSAVPSIPNVSPANVKGLGDKVVGLAEEIVGSVAGNERLTKRGQLHQQAGTQRLEALKHEANAGKEKVKAATAEQGQKSAQAAKESS
jgi:uncharacterized protein YjbJ (UPF0337 family)